MTPSSHAPDVNPTREQQALEEADRVWSDRSWSDVDGAASWTVHAGLLHVTGANDRLRRRLEQMERIPEHLGPPTFYVAGFEALAAAAAGDRAAALDHLRTAREQHWAGMPGVEDTLLAFVAVVHVLAGEPDRARELLDRSGLRARHPGPGIVRVHYRRLLDLPLRDVGRHWHTGSNPEISALLDHELAG